MKRILLFLLLTVSASAQVQIGRNVQIGGAGGGGGSTPGGANFSIQYNNSSTFGGASFTGLVYARTTGAPIAATYANVVGLWTACTSGYLKFDGTCSTPTGPTLQTNGTNNGSQTLLNLVAGSNVTLSNSGGNVTINSTGGGGGSGTVTSFAAPSASWPTWLVPTVVVPGLVIDV